MSERPPRTTAEWVSLIGSAAVVLLVVALILAQIPGNSPAAPVARVAVVREVGESFHVDVTVHNGGNSTAAMVQVAADLTIGDQTFSGDQVIDFLSGGADRSVTFVFGQDPVSGQLRVAVTGYAEP
jgi:uncharacterized protein (TIGR02588 family)